MLVTAETTVADVEETLAHLVMAARSARDPRGYDIMHRRIDTHLGIWQALTAADQ